MAGEVSKDLTRRVLLPEEIVHAHEEGIIHFHDMDYYAQKEHNCDLINLEDMLQNGTVISETMIERPKSFFTACNVTTQIVAQVASNQYGGQSFTLSHLVPFVDVSRQKIHKSVVEERKEVGESLDEEIISKITERRLREEIRSGIQTIQYQLITLMTCNGQAPFVTVFMYLDEVPEGQARDDLAMIIEEVLVQRMKGVKNEKFQVLVSDRACCTVYCKAYGSGLHFSKNDAGTEAGRCVYLYGLSFFPYSRGFPEKSGWQS